VKTQSIAPFKEEEQVTQEDKDKFKDSIKLLKANKAII
jgi:hypothetical protein